MRVALYARVSTSNGQQDPEMQLRELREHCKRQGWTIVREYVEHASGARSDRPRLAALLEAAEKKRFDAVLVWKLDRFGRSLIHLAATVQRLRQKEVQFISLKDGFDLTTANGRLLFNVLSSFAEFERELIQERIRAGLANRRAKGLPMGAPRRFQIDLADVQRRHKKGESLYKIAASIGCSAMLLSKRLRQR